MCCGLFLASCCLLLARVGSTDMFSSAGKKNPRKSPLVITFTDCRGSWSKPVSGCSWS